MPEGPGVYQCAVPMDVLILSATDKQKTKKSRARWPQITHLLLHEIALTKKYRTWP